jgi:hypothetical protein
MKHRLPVSIDPSTLTNRKGSGSASVTGRKCSGETASLLEILPPFDIVRSSEVVEIDHDTASCRTGGDRFMNGNLGVSQIVGRNGSEDVGRPHSERRAVHDLLAERTSPITEKDFVVALLDDVESPPRSGGLRWTRTLATCPLERADTC